MLVSAALLTGCGVTTSQQVYSQALIKQVGAGSRAEAQLVPTVRAQTKTGLFSDPATSQATAYLLEGQLDKLSESDLAHIASASKHAANATGGIVAVFSKLQSAITAATVDRNSFTGLPDGSRTFIAEWDQYLTITAKALANLQSALTGMSPIYRKLPGLLRAARETARLRSTVQFDKVRRVVLNDLRPRIQQIQSAMQGNRSAAAVERQFVDFVNHNQQAQAIVTRVNHDYPTGWLAQQFQQSGQ